MNDYTGSYDPSQYLSNIADDTDSIADSMEMTGEELKYLRDIAERDAHKPSVAVTITCQLPDETPVAFVIVFTLTGTSLLVFIPYNYKKW